MNYDVERCFIETFVVKSKQERLLFELSGKKRKIGISRFCHNAEKLLVKENIITSGNHLYYEQIVKTIEKYETAKDWYSIAYQQTIDQRSFPLDEALDLVLGNGMAAILISESMAFVECEQCMGTPLRYILHAAHTPNHHK